MALTASIHLTRVFITLAGNTNTGVNAGSSGSIGGGGARGETRSIGGEFRSYANGVTRLVVGTDRTRIQSLALRALSSTQVATLLALTGKTCLFRDTYGARFYGSFLITDQTTIPFSGATVATMLTDVGLSITEVTYSEAV